MISIGFGLSCLGFILLSLSLKRHYLQLRPDGSGFERWRPLCRIGGYVLVTLGLLPCILLRGPWIGLVLWVSILAAAAMLQAMLLCYRPGGSIVFACGALALILAGLLSWMG